jgi:hypothetical protein
MILLYILLLLFLGAIKVLIDRRLVRLEQKHSRTAKAADALLGIPLYREGNSNRFNPYENAKRQYQLGLLVQKRDRLEAKHDAWMALSEWFNAWLSKLRDWKGKKLPYTLGVLDVSFLLYLVDYFGVGEYVSVRALAHWVKSLLGG